MADEAPVILLAASLNLLLQEIERPEYQHLVNDRLKTDLRAFAARVERALESDATERRVRLVDEPGDD